MKKIKSIKSISSILLAEEALQRGITVKHLNPYREDEAFLELNYKKHKEFIIGQRTSKTSLEAYWILENKELTKEFLRRNGINVATGKAFKKNDFDKVVAYCEKIKFPVVIKPVAGAHGNLVFIGLKNKKNCNMAIKKIFQENTLVLAEKEFKGKEFRFITTAKKVLAVTYRDPANVIGDGLHNVNELIKIKNSNIMRGEKNEKPLTKIKVDNITRQNLIEQNIKLDFIPAKGKKIYLRKESNISTGGDSIDVTDIVHPELKKIAIMSVRAIPGLAFAGVDLMTSKDISKKPAKSSYIIVELNSSPGIYPQRFPYKGKSRNVAKEIINILFPEIKK